MNSENGEEFVEHVERKAKIDPKPSLNISTDENSAALDSDKSKLGESDELGESTTEPLLVDVGQTNTSSEVPLKSDLFGKIGDEAQSNSDYTSIQDVEYGSLINDIHKSSVESKLVDSEAKENETREQNSGNEVLKEQDATESLINFNSVTHVSTESSSDNYLKQSKEEVEVDSLNRVNKVESTKPFNGNCDNDERNQTEQSQINSTQLKQESTEESPNEDCKQDDDIPKYAGYEDLMAKELEQAEKKASQDEWLYILGHDRLRKRIIRPGEADARPLHGQRITVKCSGRVEGAAEDSLIDQHDSLSFVLGDGDFIHAFDLAVALMDKGEIAEVFTEARFAYGELGREPDVPPNANILYTIELISYSDMPEPSLLPVKMRVELGDGKRERGNELYRRQEYSRAIDLYTRALKLLDDEHESHSSASVEDLQLLVDTRLKCYNNLAAAQIMIEAWDAAIKSCDRVLLTQPENVKALFRKAKCLTSKGDITQAVTTLRKAQKIDPDSKIVQQELMRLNKRCKADAASERALYQRMLGTDKNQATAASHNTNDGGRRLWYYLGAAAAATVASGWAAYRYLH